ncbi:aspartate ammonia-lyase [Paenibacillus sp. P32E]|uniref:aspartate ammonia-lyase n=1 Tax=Paenibacillus sp. P32E TaxID=1349434 RepID=UPI00093F9548|nr:aspartate ammonia-lyase [Paenibacillus sp. P32E]OKP88997.1 aspartate ammonia-lyase [Paenibacillus sp. P32E]
MTDHTAYRIESDSLGSLSVPQDAYYGIHTARAKDNFRAGGRPANLLLLRAIVRVKQAAAEVNGRIHALPQKKAQAILEACREILEGRLDAHLIVDAYQGGAGTSSNMNVNEVIANRSIELLGGVKGDYSIIHPIDDVNLHQSTNDVYPTALRIAVIPLLRQLSEELAALQEAFQAKEREYADLLRLGRTQLMDALPILAGQSFGACAKATARDRWRLYKSEERLREINIGGTAVGTGMNAPLDYIYAMADVLRELTGLGLYRSDFPMDTTQNMDVFVEVSGLLKAAAVNLLKISNDFRLLSSGPAGGIGEYILPAVQAGSSIMPGKVNPVIAEMLGSVAMRVIANDTAVTLAAASGQLELNAFTPVLAEALLESLELLLRAVPLFRERCLSSLTLDEARCREHVERSGVMAAATIAYLGYDTASELAKAAAASGRPLEQLLLEGGWMTGKQIHKVLHPLEVTKPGIPGRSQWTVRNMEGGLSQDELE